MIGWLLLALGVWLIVSVLVALVLGRVVACADAQMALRVEREDAEVGP